MTGNNLHVLRKRSGLGVIAFALALGYSGNRDTLSRKIRRYEKWDGPLPAPVVLRAEGFALEVDAKQARERRRVR